MAHPQIIVVVGETAVSLVDERITEIALKSGFSRVAENGGRQGQACACRAGHTEKTPSFDRLTVMHRMLEMVTKSPLDRKRRDRRERGEVIRSSQTLCDLRALRV